jgi:hypothetical protein
VENHVGVLGKWGNEIKNQVVGENMEFILNPPLPLLPLLVRIVVSKSSEEMEENSPWNFPFCC